MKKILLIKLLSICLMANSGMSIAQNDTGSTSQKNMTLAMAHTDTEVVVVSGSRSQQKLKDVAGSISVLTSEDLDKQLISNMRDLFKYDPSINVTGNRGDAQNIVVRGLGSDRILMIKDGMRMNEGYGADGANDIIGRGFIDTETLKQVEVAKGAASSLYGSDALGGIVVFTTKDASDMLTDGESFAGSVKLGYDGDGEEANASITLAGLTGNIEHFFNVGKRDGKANQNFKETLPDQDIESESILYKIKLPLNDTNFISFSADLWKQESDGTIAQGLLQPFRNLAMFGYQIIDENSQGDQENKAFRLAYHAEQLGWADTLDTFIYQNDTEQVDVEFARLDINAPMFGVFELRDMWRTGIYEQETQGFITQATKSLKLGGLDNQLGFGLDIEKTDSRRTVRDFRIANGAISLNTSTEKFPKNETKRLGAYVNDQIKLLDETLVVTPSLRYDRYDLDPNGALKSDNTPYQSIEENQISFNIGALYYLDENLSLFAQYGQGFKVPPYDLAYIEQDNFIAGYRVIPSDDLDPEESDSYEIGIRGQVDSIAFTGAIFYNKYDDFITTETIDTQIIGGRPIDIFQYQNIDSVTIKGAEFGITYYLNNHWSTFFNAAYQDGKDDETDDYIDTISPLSGNAGVTYQAHNWNIEMIANWARAMTKVNDGDERTDGYVSIDLLAEYEVTEHFVINIAANNLLDKEYINFSNTPGPTQATTLEARTEAGRNVSASIKYRF